MGRFAKRNLIFQVLALSACFCAPVFPQSYNRYKTQSPQRESAPVTRAPPNGSAEVASAPLVERQAAENPISSGATKGVGTRENGHSRVTASLESTKGRSTGENAEWVIESQMKEPNSRILDQMGVPSVPNNPFPSQNRYLNTGFSNFQDGQPVNVSPSMRGDSLQPRIRQRLQPVVTAPGRVANLASAQPRARAVETQWSVPKARSVVEERPRVSEQSHQTATGFQIGNRYVDTLLREQALRENYWRRQLAARDKQREQVRQAQQTKQIEDAKQAIAESQKPPSDPFGYAVATQGRLPAKWSALKLPVVGEELTYVSQLSQPPLEEVVADEMIPLETGDLTIDYATKLEKRITDPMLEKYPSKHRINLDQAILAALEFSPEIAILDAQQRIQKEEITRQQASFDWNTFIQNTWDETNRPVASALDGVANRSETHDWLTSYGVNKSTLLGGSWRLAQDLGISDSNSSFFDPPNQANATIALEFDQPLLRGGGRRIGLSQINIAIANSAASHQDFLSGTREHVLTVTRAYWDLVRNRGELIVQRELYERALETRRFIRERIDIDVGPVQLSRAEATVNSRQAAVLNAENVVLDAQNNLLRQMYGKGIGERIEIEFVPSSSPLLLSRRADVQENTRLALTQRAEIRSNLQAIKVLAIEEGIAKNSLLPLLGLTMSLSNQGLRGNRGLASAVNEQFSFGDPTYGLALAYEFPIGNRAARAGYRQAKLRVLQAQQRLEQQVADIHLEVRNAVNQVNLQDQQRAVRKQALEKEERALNIVRERTKNLFDGENIGALYVDTLLAAQDRFATAQNDYLGAITAYAQALFDLARANGSLLRHKSLGVGER